MTQNLHNGGLYDNEGTFEDRWPTILERIRSVVPAVDVLLLTEAVDWDRHGHKQLSRAMSDLDMDTLPLPPSKTGYRPIMLYRPEKLGRWYRSNSDFSQETVHGFTLASFTIPELPQPLTIVAAHLNPYGADKALQEAKLVATRGYRYGPFAIVGGDMNYPPAHGPEPDYSAMRPYNLASRTLLIDPDDNTPPQPDRRIGWMMEKSGYVDTAWHLYQQTGDERCLEPTATDDRIDQIWVTQPLADAVSNYSHIDTPPEASDHRGVVVQLDTDRIDTTQSWEYT